MDNLQASRLLKLKIEEMRMFIFNPGGNLPTVALEDVDFVVGAVIVGNSGDLLMTEFGKEIDSYDAVIQDNEAPINEKYVKYVGLKRKCVKYVGLKRDFRLLVRDVARNMIKILDGSTDGVYDSFDAMGLQESFLRGIYAYGFEKPSAIQQRGIIPFCPGLDVIQQAQSGTGKTTTFCCGILQQLDYGIFEYQALVLAPTRELAQQIEKVIGTLGDYLGVKVHVCVGGTSIHEDQCILSSDVHVVVGKPDHLFDMLQRQTLCSDYIKMFVLDKADEMLSDDFKDQICTIFQLLPSKIQVVLNVGKQGKLWWSFDKLSRWEFLGLVHDVGVIKGVVLFIQNDLKVTEVQEEIVVGSLFVILLFGSLACGRLLGGNRLLVSSLLMFTLLRYHHPLLELLHIIFREFKSANVEGNSKLLVATVVVVVAKTVLMAILLIDKVRRKPVLYVSMICMTIYLLSLGFCLSLLSGGSDGIGPVC